MSELRVDTITDELGTGSPDFPNGVTISNGAIDGTPVGNVTPSTGDFTDLEYTGTLTGGTGVVNLGSGQVVKDASGNVGIGTTAPSQKLEIVAAGNTFAKVKTTTGSASIFEASYNNDAVVSRLQSNGNNAFVGTMTNHPFDIATNGTGKMRIDSSGNVGVGTTSPRAPLSISTSQIVHNGLQTSVFIAGDQNPARLSIARNTSSSDGAGELYFTSRGRSSFSEFGCGIRGRRGGGDARDNRLDFFTSRGTGGGTDQNVVRMSIDRNGGVNIIGSLSKGSGSFKIDHPLKPDTHHLVHSFVEGPQADLIYRGKVSLVNGKATVNIDEAGRMTEGTFEALNCNVQCFTNNESGWTAVRGRVSGNILTIEAQDESCTDEISWMVIGERCDQHMIDTDWTDENGRVITEPEKEQQDAD